MHFVVNTLSRLKIPILDLIRILTLKLEKEIPVISVVAIMGTTEESAVDPLTEVLDIREKFREKVSVETVHFGRGQCLLLRTVFNWFSLFILIENKKYLISLVVLVDQLFQPSLNLDFSG